MKPSSCTFRRQWHLQLQLPKRLSLILRLGDNKRPEAAQEEQEFNLGLFPSQASDLLHGASSQVSALQPRRTMPPASCLLLDFSERFSHPRAHTLAWGLLLQIFGSMRMFVLVLKSTKLNFFPPEKEMTPWSLFWNLLCVLRSNVSSTRGGPQAPLPTRELCGLKSGSGVENVMLSPNPQVL